MKAKLALDTAVGQRRVTELIQLGYSIVVIARESETDESWLNRAFVEGAQFAISPDLDVPRLIEQNNYPMIWINYPSDKAKFVGDLVDYIDMSVKTKTNVFRNFTGEPIKKKAGLFGFMKSLFLIALVFCMGCERSDASKDAELNRGIKARQSCLEFCNAQNANVGRWSYSDSGVNGNSISSSCSCEPRECQ